MKQFMLLMALCLSIGLSAQNFISGYVINNQNDTLRGLLAVKSNKVSAQKCFLKNANSKEIKIYTPDQISQYRYDNGKFYISSTIPNDSTQQKHYLEFLVDGIVDLYYYQDELSSYYYIRDNNNVLTELKNSQYTEKIYGTFYQRNKNEYVRVLAPLLQQSSKTCEKLMRTPIDYKPLISLIEFYHKDVCTENECVVYTKELKKEKAHLGIIAGLSSMKIRDADLKYEYNPIYFPKFGLYIDLPFSFINNQKLGIRLENLYSIEKQNGNLTYNTTYYKYQVQLNEKRFNMTNNLYLKYKLNREEFSPVLIAGVSIKSTLNSSQNTDIFAFNPYSTAAFEEHYTGKCNYLNMEVGPFVGIGLNTKLLNVPMTFDLRYNYSSGLTSSAKYKISYFSLNMGIQLF